MPKRILFHILSAFLIVVSICSCKKEKPTEASLTGTWELNKITFVETNQTFLLDSFRNVFKVNLTLNGDSSFSETEEIGGIYFGPWTGSNTPIVEYYNSPRHPNARYLVNKYNYALHFNSNSFSVKQDSLVFKVSYNALSSVMEQIYSRKFNLKNNNELDIERLDLIIFNKESSASLTHKLKFSYRRR